MVPPGLRKIQISDGVEILEASRHKGVAGGISGEAGEVVVVGPGFDGVREGRVSRAVVRRHDEGGDLAVAAVLNRDHAAVFRVVDRFAGQFFRLEIVGDGVVDVDVELVPAVVRVREAGVEARVGIRGFLRVGDGGIGIRRRRGGRFVLGGRVGAGGEEGQRQDQSEDEGEDSSQLHGENSFQKVVR